MVKTKTSIAVLLCVVLAGCATPYRPYDGFHGYYDVQLDDNVYMVSFVGNSSTTSDTNINYALLRSAQLTLQKGFHYFTIASGATAKDTQTGYITTYAPTGFVMATPYTATSPSTKNIVVMFMQKPKSVVSYHAQTVFGNLSKISDLSIRIF